MGVRNAIKRNSYFDSVVLMGTASRLSSGEGVTAASLMMGTPANKELLREAGLLTAEGDLAGPNDLIIALDADSSMLDRLVAAAEAALERKAETGAALAMRPRTLGQASLLDPELNLALISTPGPYAAAEALKALKLGMHVFMFSDNVTLEQEVILKAEAGRRDRIVMGPDCGTSILNGVPLGFANEVRRGPVGLIGASGTGLQMVSCLLDRSGSGVSQVIGVGGRDLSVEVGGRSMLYALEALGSDEETEVIVVVSKPPAPSVAEAVLSAGSEIGKPVVAAFLGARPAPRRNLRVAGSLEEAAVAALEAAGLSPIVPDDPEPPELAPGRSLVRALYSGGTFAYEAGLLMASLPGGLTSHVPHAGTQLPTLPDNHLVLDLGEDEFTVGRPHPMIDPSIRLEFLSAAGRDPRTAVIVLDVVIGHGAAPDPSEALATEIARLEGPAVVAFVCGTDRDPQNLGRQEAVLRQAGATVVGSSTAAARLALRMVGAGALF